MSNILCDWCGDFKNGDTHSCLSGYVQIRTNPHSIAIELLEANELILKRLTALEQKIDELKRN